MLCAVRGKLKTKQWTLMASTANTNTKRLIVLVLYELMTKFTRHSSIVESKTNLDHNPQPSVVFVFIAGRESTVVEPMEKLPYLL